MLINTFGWYSLMTFSSLPLKNDISSLGKKLLPGVGEHQITKILLQLNKVVSFEGVVNLD